MRNLLVLQLLLVIISCSAKTHAQQGKGAFVGKFGLGTSNIVSFPYHKKALKFKGENMKKLTYSLGYQYSIANWIDMSLGLTYKEKGTVIKLLSYQYHSGIWKEEPYTIVNPTLAPFLTALVNPFKGDRNIFYLVGGMEMDIILKDKPNPKYFFNLEIPAYFDESDYKRTTINFVVGAGLRLYRELYAELLFSPVIIGSVNKTQIYMRDNYWSITFTAKSLINK